MVMTTNTLPSSAIVWVISTRGNLNAGADSTRWGQWYDIILYILEMVETVSNWSSVDLGWHHDDTITSNDGNSIKMFRWFILFWLFWMSVQQQIKRCNGVLLSQSHSNVLLNIYNYWHLMWICIYLVRIALLFSSMWIIWPSVGYFVKWITVNQRLRVQI